MKRPSRHEVRAGLKVLIGLLLALAVPGLACYCYYAVIGVGAARSGWAPVVGLAVPLALVAGVGLAAALLARARRPWVVRACAIALAAAVLLLLIARLHLFGF